MSPKSPAAAAALLVAFAALQTAGSVSDRGETFTDEEPIALDLGGKMRAVKSWRQDKWNGQALSIKNGTLVMSRPELTTRVDRDFIGYTDKDLLPPFGFLPPEGKAGEYVAKKFGRGRYFLFTGRGFPSETKKGREAYSSLVRRLASEVRQTVRISSDDPETVNAITYAVYGSTAYFLNMDTRRERTFHYEISGRKTPMVLAPCEIRSVKL